jgi:hypothetical protein
LKKSRVTSLHGNFFGEYVHFDDNGEVEYPYRDNFFIMKAVGKWLFRVHENYLSEEDGLISLYVPPKLVRRFEKFQWVKVFRNDKTYWISEEKFYERIRSRIPFKKEDPYNRFLVKYEIMFN